MADEREFGLDDIWEVDGVPMFYDRDGVAITLRAFGELRENWEYRTVARDAVGDFDVITCWLGTDQGPVWLDEGDAPLIFGSIARTRVSGEFLDEREVFSSSLEAARKQHVKLVEELGVAQAALSV
jgi:hypothetical protein